MNENIEKIKRFLKDYWVWLLVGVVFGTMIGILIWFYYLNKEEDMNDEILVKTEITIPYRELSHPVDISLETNERNFDSREEVFKIARPSSEFLNSVALRFVDLDDEISPFENYSAINDDSVVSYNQDTGILSIFAKEEGLKTDFTIRSIEDMISFLNEDLNIKTVRDSRRADDDGNILYTGYLDINSKEVGSPNLNGYGYKLTMTQNGRLKIFQLLGINESDIEDTFTVFTINLADIVRIPKYPAMIFNTKIEDSFNNLPALNRASSYLTSLSVNDIETIYALNSFDNPFLLPTFKLMGDGNMVDSESRRYWTVSEMYICAVDPEYMEEREEEMIFLDTF